MNTAQMSSSEKLPENLNSSTQFLPPSHSSSESQTITDVVNSETSTEAPKLDIPKELKNVKKWRKGQSHKLSKGLAKKQKSAKPKPGFKPSKYNCYCDKKSSLDSLDEKLYCIYITSSDFRIYLENIEEAVRGVVSAKCRFKECSCGIIAIFTNEIDVDRVLKLDLAKVFGCPVQVGSLCSTERRYRRFVTFRDVPWCIPIAEISNALKMQEIHFGKILRMKNNVKVEVFNACDVERLLREGLNFYNCGSFAAVAENLYCGDFGGDIVQCYKCQGFWHTAHHCRYSVRCVRCGENHEMEFCPRPKSNPVCCNCGGPHHAAYKLCPVKLQMLNSVKGAFTLANKPRAPSVKN